MCSFIKQQRQNEYRKWPEQEIAGDLSGKQVVDMSEIKDIVGNVLEHILVMPLFGETYKFTHPREAIAFIKSTEDATMGRPMTFAYFDITILYKSSSEIKMKFLEKDEPIRILSVLFNLPAEE